ncbi:MAG TPA: hypothetical protein VFZ25_11325, partial [Chloroflexota bacterium]|nr:hypothetical protein [Chloroflexota bacterium]
TGTVGSDFHVFVHVVDQAGKLVAQHDGPPDQGFCPTTYWKTGLAVKDAHRIALPANLPPGDYALDIGLYSLQTMQRLPAFDGHGNAIGDQRRTTVDIRPRG